MSKKPKAVATIRMSTDDQIDSPIIQRDLILRHFGAKYEIVHWYEDLGKSGSKDKEKRTAYLRMLTDAKKKGREWNVILCLNRSRFSREDAIAAAQDKQLLRSLGIRVETVQDGAIDWGSSTGRIVDAVMTENQNAASITISANSLNGKVKKAKDGKTFGQTTPYGLARLVTDQAGRKTLIKRTERFKKPREWQAVFVPGDEEEIAVVRWIFAEFLKRDISYHQIAKELNDKKIPSPTGKYWVYQVVLELLQNQRYIGNLTLGVGVSGSFNYVKNGEVVSAAEHGTPNKKHQRDQIIVATATHEGIISEADFAKVQEKIKRRRTGRTKSPREEGFALTGVVICGQCGKKMYGNERKDPKRHRVGVSYACKGAHRSYQYQCGQWKVHQDDLLPWLIKTLGEQIDDLLRLTPKPHLPRVKGNRAKIMAEIDKATTAYQLAMKRFLAASDDIAADLQLHCKELKAKLQKLKEQEAIPDESNKEYLARYDAWQKAWKESQTRLVEVEQESRIIEVIGRPDLKLTYKNSYSPAVIRELLLSLGVTVTLWFDRGVRQDGTPARSWKIAKIQLKTANSIPTDYDSPASLIV